ncbi:aldehyde dehydrogenase family protein [Actinosynnema sp. NPDC020468]|uniref:aldehyde dehydrogenase family protein n=1 Tax=Actinosynnema sp. NPDC020468 TaxID=3154488 RepID=UPI0033D92D34
MLIDGRWVDAVGGDRFPTVDPECGVELATVPQARSADVDLAVRAAGRAVRAGSPWRTMAAAGRGRLLRRISDLVLENGEELALVASMDDGRPVTFARYADVPMAAQLFRHMADRADRVVRAPIGVVGQILPRHSPLLMAVWRLAPALAAGCAVVLKPAGDTPLPALWIAELVQQAGVPDGVVNVLTGDHHTGRALITHQGVDAVAFTGSAETGQAIATLAAAHPRPVLLEVGGNAPDVVHGGGDLAHALAGPMGDELLRDYLR